ncbi:hypothetical protein EU527_06150 [Candidatus Thorarchaeota archaeon]|nr:MAG: hypothetical protein EU527_06150 [Candidatus Thorarchaeota archaeon]
MPKWDAAVATQNPRILYRTVQLLKKLGIKFIICSPADTRCDQSHVIITGIEDGHEHHDGRVAVQEDFDVDLVQIEIISKLNRIKYPYRAIIGIDPGMTSGIAMVIDGIVVYKNSLISPEMIANLCERLTLYAGKLFPDCQKIVRIGTGFKLYTALLLRSINKSTSSLTIELVNEKCTTIIGGAKSDESSAILIAGRTGRDITAQDIILEPKEGYIRSLKQFVKKLTRGQQTISSYDAREILTKNKTIEETLKVLKS